MAGERQGPRGHVVFATTDFPPVTGTNVQPNLKLVRYLPEAGQEVIVVTPHADDLLVRDDSQLAELPASVRVVPCRLWDPLVRRWVRTQRALGIQRPGADRRPRREAPASLDVSHWKVARVSRELLLRFVKLVLDGVVYVPDQWTPWIPPAARATLKELRRYPRAVLLTSSPAYSSHVLGLIVKVLTRRPWVADFRDVWVGRPYRRVRSRAHEAWERFLEGLVVRLADRITVASPAYVDLMASRHGNRLRAKSHWVPNGFDPADYEGPLPEPSGEFRVVYTGAMFGAETPVPFLTALGRLARRAPALTANVRVDLVGPMGEDERIRFDEILAHFGIAPLVKVHGILSHADCVRLQRTADLLLLLSGPEHTENIRGKTAEYLAAGKPILAMIPPRSIQADVLRWAGAGIIVPSEDEAAAEAVLEDILQRRGHSHTPLPPPREEEVRRYDARRLAVQMAAIVTELQTPA